MNVKARLSDDGRFFVFFPYLGAHGERTRSEGGLIPLSDLNRSLTVPLLCSVDRSGFEVEGLYQLDGGRT